MEGNSNDVVLIDDDESIQSSTDTKDYFKQDERECKFLPSVFLCFVLEISKSEVANKA